MVWLFITACVQRLAWRARPADLATVFCFGSITVFFVTLLARVVAADSSLVHNFFNLIKHVVDDLLHMRTAQPMVRSPSCSCCRGCSRNRLPVGLSFLHLERKGHVTQWGDVTFYKVPAILLFIL